MRDRPRVLITGGAGFIGRHLVDQLDSSGYGWEVIGVDRPHGDLLTPGVASDLLAMNRPDIVVHLAAQVGRLFGEDDIRHTVASNALMTTVLAQACTAWGARMVYASTSEVYGDQGPRLCNEDGLFKLPHNLYGLTKRWGEEACQLYAPDGLIVLRFSMPYGPGVAPGRGRAAMLNVLHQAETRQRIPIHRGAERSWCWIGDTVHAVELILQAGEPGAYNVGRDDDAVSMHALARMACEMTRAPDSLIDLIDAPVAQTVVKRLATDKIRGLGWQPTVELPEGMRRVLEWVRKFDAAGERVAA